MHTQSIRHSLQPVLPGLFPEPAPIAPRQPIDPIRVHEDTMRARHEKVRALVATDTDERTMAILQRDLAARLAKQVELFEQEAAIFWSGVWTKHHGCYGKHWCNASMCEEYASCPLAEILREEGRRLMEVNR